MTSLSPAATSGPLGRTSMPCSSRVNGIAAGLLIKHTADIPCFTHTHPYTRTPTDTIAAGVPLDSSRCSRRHTYKLKNHIWLQTLYRPIRNPDRDRKTSKPPSGAFIAGLWKNKQQPTCDAVGLLHTEHNAQSLAVISTDWYQQWRIQNQHLQTGGALKTHS